MGLAQIERETTINHGSLTDVPIGERKIEGKVENRIPVVSDAKTWNHYFILLN